MFRTRSTKSSKQNAVDREMAAAVREACDAANADIARERWLELELERQRQLACASAEQLSAAESENEGLTLRVQQLEAALAQHEAYAKLEAQGAQHIEKEIRKLQSQLKGRAAELRELQQQLQDARAQMQADEQAGAAVETANNASMESHRRLLRKLFALVVRASLAVQALQQQAPDPYYSSSGMVQCIEVLESLIGLRHTCAQLLSESGITSSSLAEAEAAAAHATVKHGSTAQYRKTSHAAKHATETDAGQYRSASHTAVHFTVKEAGQYRATSHPAVQMQTGRQYSQCSSTNHDAIHMPDGSQYRGIRSGEPGVFDSSRSGYSAPQAQTLSYQMQDPSAEFKQFGVSLSAVGGVYTSSSSGAQQPRSYQQQQQQQQQGYGSGISGSQSVYSNRCESAPLRAINTHYHTNSSSKMHNNINSSGSNSSMQRHTSAAAAAAAAAAAVERGTEGYPQGQHYNTYQSRGQQSTTHNGVYDKQPQRYDYKCVGSSRSELLSERNTGYSFEQPVVYSYELSSKHAHSSNRGNSGMYGERVSPIEQADEYRSRTPGGSRSLGQSGVSYASKNINPPSPIWR